MSSSDASHQSVPQCIGIILDGNRRWAKERGLPTVMGHREGVERLRETVRWIQSRGIKHLVVYAFSTENWNRTFEEVSYMMDLIREKFTTNLKEIVNEGVRIKVVGQKDRFAGDLQEIFSKTEQESDQKAEVTLWVCLSYGGRAELVEAARKAAQEGEITEETIAANLWTAGMPDPDIVIRTGGQQRLSNFLPWQSTYSELFFLKEYWPAFSEQSLDSVLAEFNERKRNFGK